MSGKTIQVDDSRVVVALGKFQLSLAQNEELMKQIGASQLLSVRRTFRDQGVPAQSWAPLAPSTLRRLKKGQNKILIRSGDLLNSIEAQVAPGRVVIGTNLVYAAVQQFGSRDRSVAIGPQTKTESESTVEVKGHSYLRLQSELGTGSLPHAGRRRIQGPRNARRVNVSAHARHQNIPPRPYLVFRPEDPARIRGNVVRYVGEAKKAAGLGGGQ
jgi:phage gpG-like protein